MCDCDAKGAVRGYLLHRVEFGNNALWPTRVAARCRPMSSPSAAIITSITFDGPRVRPIGCHLVVADIYEAEEQQVLKRRVRASAHLASPLVLRGLLSEAKMADIVAYVREMRHCEWWADGTCSVRDADWIGYGDTHWARFLHAATCFHGGQCRTLAQAHTTWFSDLLAEVRQQADAGGLCSAGEHLNIRCVEYHHYTVGSGLLDVGHIDQDSVLTLSVQLATLLQDAGGRFSTTDASGVTEYELQRGDAILFCSEQVHNVSTLTRGTRTSLVMELWRGPANGLNRYS